MPRTLAFLAALALTTISLSTTAFASVADGLSFTLQPSRTADRVQLSLRSGRYGRNHGIVQFKAIGVSAYVAALALIGYRNLSADEISQLKALNVPPEFIAGFERAGYRNLPVDSLVQLKALGVTPDYVRRLEARGVRRPTVDERVAIRAIGIELRPGPDR